MPEHPSRTARANADQTSAWNGPEGANWAASSARRVADADLVEHLLLAARLTSQDCVLDIGCGTGELTRRAARVAARGRAIGIDLSELMVGDARAAATAAGVSNVAFEVGDAQTHPFEPRAFDVALSHFGTMFFDDPVAAFANVGRSLRAQGRLLFVCPGPMNSCDWYGVPLAALYGARPTMEVAPSIMFSLADPPRVREILSAAGFVDITIDALDAALWFGRDAESAAWALVGSGPVRSFLEQRPGASVASAHAALTDAVTPYLGADGVRIPGSHWLVDATWDPAF
jgi:SAM-dependent methyltransferase